MILTNGINTRTHSTKHDGPMAVFMEAAWMDGHSDDEAGTVDTIGHYIRMGRRIMVTHKHGFVLVHRYPTVARAEAAMDDLHTLERFLNMDV